MRRGCLGPFALVFVLCAEAALAAESCAPAPYLDGPDEIVALARRLTDTLVPHPSLAKALTAQAPVLCIDDSLVEEQAYFEPKSNRVVLNADLDQDFQLAIMIHEVRHLEQFVRGSCPTTSYTLNDYTRARLALEADASAVGIYVAWTLREGGIAGPWDKLKSWPTHGDLVARFESEMAAGAGEVAATSATFAQWYTSAKRREMYTFAICWNYLDALDREKILPGRQVLPETFGAQLCVMPDGRPYECVLPP